MRFFTAFALLPALFTSIIASPVAANADISGLDAAAADVPGVQRLERVSKQLTELIKEIKDFKEGDIPAAQQMVNHGAQTLRTLNDAVVEIEQGPDIDLWTATSYAKVAIPLTSEVHDLSDSLKARKSTIAQLGLENAIYLMLDAAYSEVSRLMRVYTKKVPTFIRPILKPWLSDLTETIGDAKEQFRDDGSGAGPAPPSDGSAPLFDDPRPAAPYTSTVIVYAPAPTGPPPVYDTPAAQWQVPSFQFAYPSGSAQRPAGDAGQAAYSPVGYAVPTPAP